MDAISFETCRRLRLAHLSSLKMAETKMVGRVCGPGFAALVSSWPQERTRSRRGWRGPRQMVRAKGNHGSATADVTFGFLSWNRPDTWPSYESGFPTLR